MTAVQATVGKACSKATWPGKEGFGESQPEAEADGSDVDTGMEVTCREQDGRTRMTIKQGGFLAAGAQDEFAGGGASILSGLGCAVAARVTDRS